MIEREKTAALHATIQKILLNEWDPIGIRDIAEAQDEYDSYVPDICEMISSQKTQSEILDFLWNVETEHMGLCGNKKKSEKIAERLFNLSV
ncbi:hypothetical protein [Micavibrio aeruginosavorus]|uniref:hypothetical protein n=1 Tax=Micavibrio aeruginosavorus TaxID=349221 RepID=UPI003F4ABE8D